MRAVPGWRVLIAVSCTFGCGSEAPASRGHTTSRPSAEPPQPGAGAAGGALNDGGDSSGHAGVSLAGGADTGPSAGAAGAGGALGSGGAGGETDSSHPICLTRLPCHSAEYAPGTGCVEIELPDGAPCSDGRVCTSQDHCEAGQCVASPSASVAQTVASVRGFGGYSEIGGESTQHGLALPLNERQLVFADTTLMAGTRVTLVSIDEQGEMTPTSSVLASFAMSRAAISSWVFADETRAQLLRLSDERFILLGTASQVFDVEDGQLQPSTVTRFGPETFPRGGVSLNDRFWTCDEFGIRSFRVDGNPPVPLLQSTYFAACEAVAVSADGRSLFAATHKGLLRLAVADDGAMTLADQWLPTTPFLNVAIAGDVLVAQDMYAPLGFGSLHAFRWQNMEPIGVYPDAQDASPLLGFALSGSHAILQRLVATSDTVGISLQGVALSNFTAEPPREAFWDRVLESSGYDYVVRPTAGFGLMVTQPIRRVWRIDQPGLSYSALHGDLQGYFESVHLVDETHAVSLDGHSRHDIDLSLPHAPSVKSTPLLGLQPARLVLGFAGHQLQSWRDPKGAPSSELGLAQVDREGLTLGGRVNVPGNRQAISGDDVVSVELEQATNRLRVRTFPLATLEMALPEQTLKVRDDFWVAGSERPAAGAFRGAMPAIIGADDDSVVIADRWESAPDVHLHWLSRADGRYGTSSKNLQVSAVGLAEQVLVRADQALVVTKTNLLLIERSDGELVVRTTKKQEGDAVALEWSKDFLYVALGSASQNVPTSLELLSPADLSVRQAYSLDDQALGLAEVGSHVVVTVRHGFSVLTPPCGVENH